MNSNRNILITGASSGIGRTTALYLDRLGFRVFATVRTMDDAEVIRKDASEKLIPIIMDVTQQKTVNDAKERITKIINISDPFCLINNAGVSYASPLECASLDNIRWIFDVNVFGMLTVTQVFLHLIRQTKGRIINISSEATLSVVPYNGPYSSSKLAIQGFSDALRRELKPFGVHVSVIIPGSIITPIWDKGDSKFINKEDQGKAYELYEKGFMKYIGLRQKLKKIGIKPEAVARTISSALTSKHPSNYYYVGLDAYLMKMLHTFTPEILQDWINNKILNWGEGK